MAEMDQVGVSVVKEEVLLKATGYARSDSNGYRKATKELIKQLCYVTRTTKNKVTTYSLTEEGRKHLVDTGLIVVAAEPLNNEEVHAHFKEILKKSVKAPESKLEKVFETLGKGDWHTTKDLVNVAGYTRSDSSGYKNIMSGMRTLGLLEKSGSKVRFSDKAFRFGRP
ncbi:unnamed protein product [Pseudo-nitzschia multistriata]|uniref:Uncharacterized protein n=1 Tax=Pseudo-nitzschia multistriata TaxID=183589 RepID=A0A448YV00_9STRA|nr:unnamed protein product [Pseudo-nitzschia multistriata]